MPPKRKADAVVVEGEQPVTKRGRPSRGKPAPAKEEPVAKRGRAAKEKPAPEKQEPAAAKKGKAVAKGKVSAADEEEEESAENGTKKAKAKPAMKKEVSVEKSLEGTDFTSASTTKDGRPWTLKVASWNINGIRAWLDKEGLSYLHTEKPDVLCVQETKCADDKIPDSLTVDGYTAYWLAGETDGYSGTGMYCKTKPIDVTYGIGTAKHDKEGRVITAEFDKYYVVTAYVPNSGRGLPRLPYRTKEWDVCFQEYLKELDKKKPVIMCGDLNVAHLDIDLKNPKTNKKTAGFTKEEREGFTNLLNEGFIDSFRYLYPEVEEKYSFWTYMGNARGKNVGWRLDYFVLSERLKEDLCDNLMRTDVLGSDHCPIVLLMAL